MNYLSDEEETVETHEPTFDELYPEDDMDEETMDIIKKHATKLNDDELEFVVESKGQKKKQTKQKDKPMSLDELLKKEQGTKPKKWSSTRADNKKSIEITKSTRHFNPRLPPFRSLAKNVKEDTIINNDEINFPSLK